MLAAIQGLADNYPKAAAIIGKKLIANPACVCRTSGKPTTIDQEKLPLVETERSAINVAEEKRRHREQYAVEQEELEREEGWRDNPALDLETQQAIVNDYRALHEQFKAEGLYQCRYSEYAKESIRYICLFAAFAGFLYCKWYLTSAVFLGFFWVNYANLHRACHMLTKPCSNKSCLLRTMQAIVA